MDQRVARGIERLKSVIAYKRSLLRVRRRSVEGRLEPSYYNCKKDLVNAERLMARAILSRDDFVARQNMTLAEVTVDYWFPRHYWRDVK